MTRQSANPHNNYKNKNVGREGAITQFTFGIINAVFFGLIIMLCMNTYMWDKEGYQTVIHDLNYQYKMQLYSVFNRDQSAKSDYQALLKKEKIEINTQEKNMHEIIKNQPLNFSTYFNNKKTNSELDHNAHEVEKFFIKIKSIFSDTVEIIFSKLVAVFASIFVFMAFIALGTLDGLLSRYIRTSEGGRESTLMFHKMSDKLIKISCTIIFLYLICPIFINPEWIVVLLSVLLLVYCRISTSNLKKYL